MQQDRAAAGATDAWWEALPPVGQVPGAYLGGHTLAPRPVRQASVLFDRRGVGLLGQRGLLVGIPWPFVADVVVEGPEEFATRAGLDPLRRLGLTVERGEKLTYITVFVQAEDMVVLRTTVGRPHVLRSLLRPVLAHLPQRRPPGLESEPGPVRIEDIPVFSAPLGRPHRVVQAIEAHVHSSNRFEAAPTKDEVDMRLREAAAALGANAVVAPSYVREVMSWRAWYPLSAFATAVVLDARDGELHRDAVPQPVFSPDREQWWDGSAWVDATRSMPPGSELSADGRSWWDGRSWRARPQVP